MGSRDRVNRAICIATEVIVVFIFFSKLMDVGTFSLHSGIYF